MTKLKTLWIISGFTLCSLVLADFSGHHGHHGHHDHHEHHDHHHDHHEDADGKSVGHHHHHEDADAKSVEKVKSVATGKLALPNLKDCKNRKYENVRRQHDLIQSTWTPQIQLVLVVLIDDEVFLNQSSAALLQAYITPHLAITVTSFPGRTKLPKT